MQEVGRAHDLLEYIAASGLVHVGPELDIVEEVYPRPLHHRLLLQSANFTVRRHLGPVLQDYVVIDRSFCGVSFLELRDLTSGTGCTGEQLS